MKNKNGISLIVLVITIIVMIILAGAIILTINNSGIISRASEAVEETNLATVKEVASLAWAEAYADGVRTVEDLADGTKGFKTRIEEALEKNKIDVEKYQLNITTSGVEVTLKGEEKAKWVKEGFTVAKGDQVLKIGELVDYTATGTDYNGGWKVLGADDEGNLLIMSAADVKSSHRLGYDTTDTTDAEKMEEAQNDWLNGAAELDGICEPYGYGEGVVGKARSITVEDVNAVTGYDPETYNSDSGTSGEPYGSGQLWQYGNEVTYKYNGTTKPAYESAVKSGTLSSAHSNGFYYYNEEIKEFAHIGDLTAGTSGDVFAKLTSNEYSYYAPELTTISATENPEAYQMIFGNDDIYYWLASPCVSTDTNYAGFGMRYVEYGSVTSCDLWDSRGNAYCSEDGVRAVVTLSSDIQFTEYTANGWSY